jgi:cysteinyl-tRNA synthetase
MIYKHLGGLIDIHGGGSDLIFPHHENEIAQSEAFMHKSPLARYWVHNGLLQLSGEKMSKSLGNLVTIKELLAEHHGEAFRFLVLGSHYRNPLTFNEETLESARRGLARLQGALRSFEPSAIPVEAPDHQLAQEAAQAAAQFRDAMDDDFNTPVALSVLFELARQINRATAADAPNEAITWAQSTLKELAGVLGLRLSPAEAPSGVDVGAYVDLLLDVRRELRDRKLWDLADTIRDRLEALDIKIEDTPTGTTWRRVGH